MRAEAGREPHDRALRDLVGELATLSTEFRRQWPACRRVCSALRSLIIHRARPSTWCRGRTGVSAR
ncbi:MmyB family transcriptional regulator [Nonomuraea sp. NPDC001699]